MQQYGTHRVGGLFGPVMVVWFITIAGLGVSWIAREPSVIGAINPRSRRSILPRARLLTAFAVLGSVFLAVTGGEALYADMGHFGRRPIRIAWFALVLPALVLNYFGQGALLLIDGDAAKQPFFLLAPSWALFPLVVLATAAAIIASQALISGAFSLTQQAIQLGYAPRLDIEHTSSHEMGQVYVPQVNWALMISHDPDRHRVRLVERARCRVRHRGHDDDGDHGRAAERGGDRAVALAEARGVRHDRACS